MVHVEFLPIPSSHSSIHKALDIGSGIGGPARHLAATTGCHLMALELQEDLHKVASDLTKRCKLEDKVTHICGNFLRMDFGISSS